MTRSFFAPYEDGKSVFIYRSEQRTIDELERTYPGEGEAYARFMDDWRPFGQAVKELFLSTPSPLNLGKKMMFGKAIQGDWKQALGKILKPYGEVVDSYFKEERVKTPLVWMAAQSGAAAPRSRSRHRLSCGNPCTTRAGWRGPVAARGC